MSYRIPKDDDIAQAIENCLSRSPRVRSLNVLSELVLTELLCVDENYRVSIERVSKLMGHANTLTTEKYCGSLSNSLAVEYMADMITEKSRTVRGEGAPLIGFGGLGNIDALIGGY
jgi:hypothetical protein